LGSIAATAASTRVPRPGEQFGAYQIIRLLGCGGMGEVFEAEHGPSGRRVALKVMSRALASEADRKRFLREGRLAASVSHPNAVYIYGSEEIQGTPVIAMELVAGGTLKDRIKRSGPFPIAEAVEAALHIIDGLEAAHTAGVLHRDIKPANCFVATDGAVKVGDFGLSISTLARGESLLTASGSVIGTPAYASPEQLRGEELTVASDIYSVGATLFHLLTGRPPHETTDFVKLITEVLDKAPPAPDKLRPEIPAGLAKVLMRCLAKDRAARFPSYAALREALLPFSAIATVPASLGLRFVAGVTDEFFAWLPSLLWLMVIGRDAFDAVILDRTVKAALVATGFYAWALLYYSLPEGFWGASLGKALCSLRVAAPNGSAPGVARAFCRVLVFSAPSVLAVLSALLIHTPADYAAREQGTGLTAYLPVWFLTTVALWVTIRRRNGFAALQDLLTRTRVVARPLAQERPRLNTAEALSSSTARIERQPLAEQELGAPAPERLGPYEIIRSLGFTEGAEVLLALDLALRRCVWIHRLALDAPPVSARRRDLSRPGRLRWLNGHRDAASAWDAYEAPEGSPLDELLARPQSWAAVRFWLHDLASEIAAVMKDDSASAGLALDRVWITSAGRAMLLDFPRPTPTAKPPTLYEPVSPVDFPAAQGFLHTLAEIALRREEPAALPPALPLHARPFLQSLSQARFESPDFLLGNLQSLLDKQAVIGRQRRAAALVFAPAIALIAGIVLGGVIHFTQKRSTRDWPEAQFPGSGELRGELLLMEWTIDDKATRRALRIHMARTHRELILDTNFWMHPKVADALGASDRIMAEEAVKDYDDVSERRRTEAEQLVAVTHRSLAQGERLLAYYAGTALFWVMFALAAILDLGCAVFLGHDFFLHIFGVAVVKRDGNPARRLRLLWRNVLAWGFCFLLAPAVFVLWTVLSGIAPSLDWTGVVAFVLAALVLGTAAFAVWKPARGMQDRLAGTLLVPR
jgi:uncharacterized RDD family membrane protein YckC/predicted Ser/Thr protein kinase